uniref:Tim44-like domain-containing protein n=1 Tax=Hyaloperonospora arabidopsidis (strain Emoy2) TaxID=559515 RepID=M4B7V1_HYAAE
MYSNEFVNFANGVVSESAAAEKMKSGLSDTCYEAFLFAMRQSRKAGNSFSLKQLDINGAYLYDVNWDRLSFAEMKQEEALEAVNRSQRLELDQQEEKKGIKEKTDVSHERTPVAFSQTRGAAPEDHTMMIERLQLDVLLETVEHLEVATADNADQVLEKKSSAVWRFESLVTQPDNIDWRIVTVL